MEALRADQPEAVKEPALGPLLKGAAAHHAGCLPAWKSLIERLFQKGGCGAQWLHHGCLCGLCSALCCAVLLFCTVLCCALHRPKGVTPGSTQTP